MERSHDLEWFADTTLGEVVWSQSVAVGDKGDDLYAKAAEGSEDSVGAVLVHCYSVDFGRDCS